MKLAARLLSLAWLPACSFPDYDTSPSPPTNGGSGTIVGPSCDDGKRNGDETGRDCGMAACSRPTTVITFSTPQLARYIRFTLTQGKNKWLSIDELRVKQ